MVQKVVQVLIAPVGIEIVFFVCLSYRRIRVLIAPVGIEIAVDYGIERVERRF